MHAQHRVWSWSLHLWPPEPETPQGSDAALERELPHPRSQTGRGCFWPWQLCLFWVSLHKRDLPLALPCSVQAAVIPALLESMANGFLVGRGGYQPSDLCVSAPTGSGKTLAFVIPLVQVSVRNPRTLQGGLMHREPALLTQVAVSPAAGPAPSSRVPGPCPGCAAHQGAGPAGTWTLHLEVRPRVPVLAAWVH